MDAPTVKSLFFLGGEGKICCPPLASHASSWVVFCAACRERGNYSSEEALSVGVRSKPTKFGICNVLDPDPWNLSSKKEPGQVRGVYSCHGRP